MDRETFEADLLREGYTATEGRKDPSPPTPMHTHEFEARLFVLDGAFTLTLEDGPHTYRRGESFSVPAGTLHAESYGPDGCAYIAGKR